MKINIYIYIILLFVIVIVIINFYYLFTKCKNITTQSCSHPLNDTARRFKQKVLTPFVPFSSGKRSVLSSDIKINEIFTFDGVETECVSFSTKEDIVNIPLKGTDTRPTLLNVLYTLNGITTLTLQKLNKIGIYETLINYDYDNTVNISILCGVIDIPTPDAIVIYYFTAICIPAVEKIFIYYVHLNKIVKQEIIMDSGSENSTITFANDTMLHRSSINSYYFLCIYKYDYETKLFVFKHRIQIPKEKFIFEINDNNTCILKDNKCFITKNNSYIMKGGLINDNVNPYGIYLVENENILTDTQTLSSKKLINILTSTNINSFFNVVSDSRFVVIATSDYYPTDSNRQIGTVNIYRLNTSKCAYILSENIAITLLYGNTTTSLSLSLSSDGNTLLVSEYCVMQSKANIWICHYTPETGVWSTINLLPDDNSILGQPVSMSLSDDGKKAVIAYGSYIENNITIINSSVKIFSISFL